MSVIDSTWKWRQLAPATPPDARGWHDMCWAGDRVIMFGGVKAGPTVMNDTWELIDGEWSQALPNTVPDARVGHRMVYDGSRVLMMGGFASDQTTVLDETWEYVGGDWNQLTVSPIYHASAPESIPARHEMVWDPDGNRALALIPTGTTGDRVWVFSSGDWARLTLATEFQAAVSAVAYREEIAGAWCDDRFVVCAGGFGNASYMADIVDLISTAWVTRVAHSNVTPAFPWRFRHRAVWTGDQMFFMGGSRNSSRVVGPDTCLGDQWLYDKNTHALTAFTPSPAPSARFLFGLVWTGERIVLFGGSTNTGGTVNAETWALERHVAGEVALNQRFGLG